MLLKIIKKLLFAFVLLYGFNMVSVYFNIVIPINLYSLFIVTLFDLPGMILVLLSIMLIF